MNVPTYFHSTALQHIAAVVAQHELAENAAPGRVPQTLQTLQTPQPLPQNMVRQGNLQTRAALNRNTEDWLWQHTMGTWLAQFQARKILNGEYAICDEARRILMGSIKNDRRAWADRLQCAATLNNAGNCSYYEGNLKEALELYKLALHAANEDEKGFESPITKGIIHNLAVVSGRIGSYQASRLYRAALNTSISMHGIAWVVTKHATVEFTPEK